MSQRRLWPYGPVSALAAAPVLWLAVAVAFWVAQRLFGVTAPSDNASWVLIGAALGLIPLALLLVDFVAERGANVTTPWLSVDFGASLAPSGAAVHETVTLWNNLELAETQPTDSGVQPIDTAIRTAIDAEIVCIDLRDGNAWWVTRLLALCAALVDVESPKAVVFVADRDGRNRVFIGWATPGAIVKGIVDANPEYRRRLSVARRIVDQLTLFGDSGEALPQLDMNALRRQLKRAAGGGAERLSLAYAPEVATWRGGGQYGQPLAVLLARVRVQLLRSGRTGGAVVDPDDMLNNLELPPDRLTIGRLTDLFAGALSSTVVDRHWSNERQIATFLESHRPYVAVVDRDIYLGLLSAAVGERIVLRALLGRLAGEPDDRLARSDRVR